MRNILNHLFITILFNITLFSNAALANKNSNLLQAHKVQGEIIIDGVGNENSWDVATWQPLDKLILGSQPTPEDFSGQFKVMWNEEQLFLLVEVVDDILFDQHADPLYLYWDDDCLEVFIDEDASGGDHEFSFNAFAYHIALDNQVVDIGVKNKDGTTNFVLLNDHIDSVWKRSTNKPNNIIWEVAINVFDDSFILTTDTQRKKQKPVKLTLGKTMGFMLAYCDNDGSKEREHFIGSTEIKAINGDKNLGYKTADVFQRLQLIQ